MSAATSDEVLFFDGLGAEQAVSIVVRRIVTMILKSGLAEKIGCKAKQEEVLLVSVFANSLPPLKQPCTPNTKLKNSNRQSIRAWLQFKGVDINVRYSFSL